VVQGPEHCTCITFPTPLSKHCCGIASVLCQCSISKFLLSLPHCSEGQKFCDNDELSSFIIIYYYAPAQGALSDDADWRLSVWRLTSVAHNRSAGGVWGRPAGWMARIGWSGPARPAWLEAAAARFRCRPGRGHIVAAARLQLVTPYYSAFCPSLRHNSVLISIYTHSIHCAISRMKTDRHGIASQDQWRREGFCHPGQRYVVPPLQPATPILSVLNKLKININLCNANAKIPNFRRPPSNAALRSAARGGCPPALPLPAATGQAS